MGVVEADSELTATETTSDRPGRGRGVRVMFAGGDPANDPRREIPSTLR